jgi:hypothetical protein
LWTRAAACRERQPLRCTNFRAAFTEIRQICPEIVNSPPQILDIHLTALRQPNAATPLPLSTSCRLIRAGVRNTFGRIRFSGVSAKHFTYPWQGLSTVWRVSRTCNRKGDDSPLNHAGPKGFSSFSVRCAPWHSICDGGIRKWYGSVSEGSVPDLKVIQNRASNK